MLNLEKIKKAAKIVKYSNYVVVFTGAGISTESGIADFRSVDGLWSRYDPDIYANYYYFLQDPSKFWKMQKEVDDLMDISKPNLAHFAIAELEKLGKVKAIITQNIDMLHQKAGTGENGASIFQLHGEYGKLHCVQCKKEFKIGEVDTKNVDYPVCECGGYIKPKVVLFGESLPPGVFDAAMRAATEADCFIVVGSSLVVTPANMLPGIAKQSGAKLIFVNKEETELDYLFDISLKGKASEILTELVKLVKKQN